MKKYDLSKLMKKAWSLYKKAIKKGTAKFADALRTAWAWLKVQAANKAIIAAAAEAAGYADYEYHTWYRWQQLGRMVIHTSEAAFQCVIADPTTRSGRRIQSFFIYSDTQEKPVS